MEKIIYTLTEMERDEIEKLYERKVALENLIKSSEIVADEILYNKIIEDYGKTVNKFQQWWEKMSSKYEWESLENHHWTVDFHTGNIVLVEVNLN